MNSPFVLWIANNSLSWLLILILEFDGLALDKQMLGSYALFVWLQRPEQTPKFNAMNPFPRHRWLAATEDVDLWEVLPIPKWFFQELSYSPQDVSTWAVGP